MRILLTGRAWGGGMSETALRQIEILTNAWDTISNMWIRDEKLSEKQQVILDVLTEEILEKIGIFLKCGE